MKKSSAAVLLIPAVIVLVMGMVPGLTMDRLADMGQSFFLAEGLEHSVHYFSLANLKGSVISLIIGAVLYIVVIRGLMMKDGRYVDRWAPWLDLENSVYRPAIALFTIAATFLCRILDSLVDGVILLARKTTHRQLKEPVVKTPVLTPREKIALRVGGLIQESFSFALLLFAAGLCITMGYLLFVFFKM